MMKEMTEERFRLWIVILLAVFIAAFIVIGLRLSANGRYTQYISNDGWHNKVIDTRTGKMEAIE